jgi:sec-independent protein translocase protein TatC
MKTGTLISHLLELRTRLMRMTLALLAVFVACAFYANDVFEWLARPLREALPKGATMATTTVMGSFTTPFTLSFYVALGLVMPYLLWELWRFVAPGLYKNEKRFAVPLFVSSVFLFYGGMAFSFFLVFPGVFRFLVSTTPRGVQMMTDINQYVSFALTMFLSFGLAFEVPIVVILLVLTGMISVEKLTGSRGYVIVAIFVVAAVITPTTDAISQIAMAGPMWLLYEAGVIVARMMVKMKRESTAASGEGEP